MRQRIIAPIFLMLLAVPSHAQAQLDAAAKAEIAKANQAVTASPTADSYAERGRIFGRNKMYQEAVDDYTKAIELMPREPGLYIRRALQFEHLRNYRGAISDSNRALGLSTRGDHDYINALRGRAACFDALHQEKQMVSDLRELRDLGDKAAATDLETMERKRSFGEH